MRAVVVHYHFFKNAGSSVDQMLRQYFGNLWTAFEGPDATSRLSPQALTEFLRDNPWVRAVSSHHLRLPPPEISDIELIPMLFLRHPIDRVGSIYWFERKQPPVSVGARFAATHSFSEYVRWRLDTWEHGVINNFHTVVLSEAAADWSFRPDDTSVAKALDLLRSLPFFGLVERYDESLSLLQPIVRTWYRDFAAVPAHVNASPSARKPTLAARVDDVAECLGPALFDELMRRNNYDIELYTKASALFGERLIAAQ